MAIDLVIRRGDTKPWNLTLKQTATSGSGFSVVNLNAAVSVKIYARRVNATSNQIDGKACSITTATSGKIRFSPATGDIGTAGTFQVYYKVPWSDGTTSRFPTDDNGDHWDTVLILDNYE